ncbi:phage tail protein [Escherichia coli]|uniref:phage tail protein n=1 Tax=Escherichia coli TaxID=562 RepID=UPI003F535A10
MPRSLLWQGLPLQQIGCLILPEQTAQRWQPLQLLVALLSLRPAGWLKCDGRAFTKEQYPVLARVYPTLRLPDLRGEFIRGWDDGRKVDTGRKLLSAQGATLLRTAMLDYYNQDTTGTSGIVGMGFNNEDSITDLREGSFKMPDGTTFSDPVVAMSDNGMQATILTSIRSGYAKGITVRPRSIALNYIVRAV